MANHILAAIYGQEGNAWTGIEYRSFPVANVIFIPLPIPVNQNGVNANSKIKVLSTNNPYSSSAEFYTDRTVDSLNNEANS